MILNSESMSETVLQTPETQAAPVSFSERALAELRKLQSSTEKPFLRVGVTGGGCSGLSYVLEFDAATEQDQHFEIGGVKMVMDPRHALYLYDMNVEFEDGLNARGFVFQNPNAKSTCGCGTSFSA